MLTLHTSLLLLAAVHCGYAQDSGGFQLFFGTLPPTKPTMDPHVFNPDCHDKLDNCNMYEADACVGQYESWARDNCAQTCKYCTGPTTAPPPCVDAIDNCASYGNEACTDSAYRNWATSNCMRTCRLCPAGLLAQLDALTTTISPRDCVDKLDCRLYGKTSCSGTFEPWARTNCMNYCGFCQGVATTAKPCQDAIPSCSQYQNDICTNPSYHLWVEDNCPKFCGICGGGGNIRTPPPIYNTPPPLHGK